jgi:hypothetical protein
MEIFDLSGTGNSRGLSDFFRSDLHRVLVKDLVNEVPVELEEECNALRARMVSLLGWPEFYGQVSNFIRTDAPKWKSAEPKGAFAALLTQELANYVEKVESQYPVLLESP